RPETYRPGRAARGQPGGAVGLPGHGADEVVRIRVVADLPCPRASKVEGADEGEARRDRLRIDVADERAAVEDRVVEPRRQRLPAEVAGEAVDSGAVALRGGRADRGEVRVGQPGVDEIVVRRRVVCRLLVVRLVE